MAGPFATGGFGIISGSRADDPPTKPRLIKLPGILYTVGDWRPGEGFTGGRLDVIEKGGRAFTGRTG